MISIALLCASEEKRREISLLLGEIGILAYGTPNLPGLKEIIGSQKPRLILAVEEDASFDEVLRETLSLFPGNPVIAVLKSRDANRAVKLMLLGSEEVLSLPLSREHLRAALNRAGKLPTASLSLIPPASLRGLYFYAFFFLALGAFGLTGWMIHRHKETLKAERLARNNFWVLPYFYPSALAFDGHHAWVADWFSQSLYEHIPGSWEVKRVIHFPNEMPVSIAVTPNAIWTVDASGKIVRRLKDLNLTPVERYDQVPQTTAIAFDGLYLWTYNQATKRLSKRLTDAKLSEVASYPYPGSQATALVFARHSLWSLDAPNREIILHDINHPDEVISRTPLPEYSNGKYVPTGLGFDGKNFWTVGQSLPPGSAKAILFKHQNPKPE